MIGGVAAMRRVAGYQMRDVARSRWLIAYALFFLVLTDALFRFGGGGSRALLSLVDIVLFIVPLVTIVFGTMYLYNAREFVELILAQPVRRRAVFGGLYAGLVGPLVTGFTAGVAIPFAIHGATDDLGTLLAVLGIGALMLALAVAASAASPIRRPTQIELTVPLSDCSRLEPSVGRLKATSVAITGPPVRSRMPGRAGAGRASASLMCPACRRRDGYASGRTP